MAKGIEEGLSTSLRQEGQGPKALTSTIHRLTNHRIYRKSKPSWNVGVLFDIVIILTVSDKIKDKKTPQSMIPDYLFL